MEAWTLLDKENAEGGLVGAEAGTAGSCATNPAHPLAGSPQGRFDRWVSIAGVLSCLYRYPSAYQPQISISFNLRYFNSPIIPGFMLKISNLFTDFDLVLNGHVCSVIGSRWPCAPVRGGPAYLLCIQRLGEGDEPIVRLLRYSRCPPRRAGPALRGRSGLALTADPLR
ncbi:MAG TPA: hypothetical protein VF184_04065 [Phycisphaeraceae bacterium]